MTVTTAKLSKKIGHETETPSATENAERGDYKRPDEKKYDLCIVHSNADRKEAFDIYKDLENRFQLKCLIFCYDDILVRFSRVQKIQDMMKKSIGTVFLLSPAFFEGPYFVIETKLAVEISCDRNLTVGIINVLSQDVGELPPLLKPYICIEAQKTCDIAAKISEAFCQIGSSFIDKLVHIVLVLSPHTHTCTHTFCYDV